MRLYDLATTMRSKNAGPFVLTIDLLLPDREAFDRVMASGSMRPEIIARLYGAPPQDVRVIPFDAILTIKVTLPRPGASSGSPGDRDVYGCQQHFPLADVEV